MIFADNFLSYPAIVNVLSSMVGLFWACYSFVFFITDSLSSLYLSVVLILYAGLLLLIMLPASAANRAAKLSKDAVVSSPGWFPEHCEKLKLIVRKRFKQQELSLTLWKIYKINIPLLINTLGTLVTYGCLLGTLGTVRNSIRSTDPSNILTTDATEICD
ncbi:uncharacterized protein CEXT_351961 [Caerostris extrusa]|uniref:Uncharacterized protein n=1 Tax=Caerostris extrusa TaxID=172846 RepID=A0AAV4QGZ5_CAEEX|nr:uncharacterized protein CEXT_351961 [Caerostris extrusa]